MMLTALLKNCLNSNACQIVFAAEFQEFSVERYSQNIFIYLLPIIFTITCHNGETCIDTHSKASSR